jgi:hypothetical protein
LLTSWPDILKLVIGFGVGGGLYWLAAKFIHFDAYIDFEQIIQSNIGRLLGKRGNMR